MLAAADKLRLRLLSRATALQVLQSTGLVPALVNLDTQHAPEQRLEAPAPAKKGKVGKVETSEAPQELAVQLPQALLLEAGAALSSAQDTLKALAASYYSKRDSGRDITRDSIKRDAEAFIASRQACVTALKAQCDDHIATEQIRFGQQVRTSCWHLLP